MSELSPEARAILEAARGDGAPTADDRARVERSLAAAIAALPPVAAQPQGPVHPLPKPVPMPGTGSAVLSATVKAMVVVALAAGGAAGIVVWSKSGQPSPRVPAAVPRFPVQQVEPAVAPPAPVPDLVVRDAVPTLVPVSPQQAPKLVPVQRPAPVFAPLDMREPAGAAPVAAAEPARPADEGALAEELKLVRQATLRANSGDAAGALELLDLHAQRYPRGTLREERAAARVQALCALGRAEEAKAETARFLSENPHSPYSARVQASCGAARP